MVTYTLILALLFVYQLKHFFADYILQTKYMLGKFHSGWNFFFPLLAHVAVHGLMTYFIVVVTLSYYHPDADAWPYALAIGGFDMLVHFIMDRLKAGPRYMGRWKPLTAPDYLAARRVVEISGGKNITLYMEAQDKLRSNLLFWWALGFDQMVHHLTHYACISAILVLAS